MLDPSKRFTVEELPQVEVYPDHASPTRFYAVPSAPRLALDDKGKPLISLLLYGRGKGPEMRLMGGQLMLTTSLGLSEGEQDTLRQALARRLAGAKGVPEGEAPDSGAPADNLPAGGEPEVGSSVVTQPSAAEGSEAPSGPDTEASGTEPLQPDASAIILISPDWLDGEVVVRLGPTLQLSGKPSMMGSNECALTASLTPDQARKVRDAWEKGLPEATISYRVQFQAAETGGSEAAASTTTKTDKPGETVVRTSSTNVRVDWATAVLQEMTREGPLILSKNEIDHGLQLLGL